LQFYTVIGKTQSKRHSSNLIQMSSNFAWKRS